MSVMKELEIMNINILKLFVGIDIHDYHLVTCQEDGIRPLTEVENIIFIFWLNKIANCMDGKLVWRGQNIKDLMKILDKEYNRLASEEEKAYHIEHYLFHRLFFFGEKARYFHAKTSSREFLSPNRNNCSSLFSEIKDKLSSHSEQLESFIARNRRFYSFFMDDSNLNIFCNVLEQHENIYWFYCILLHRLGKSASMPSQYISNSEDIIIADRFSTSNCSKAPVIIMYVIPNNQLGRLYSSMDINYSLDEMNECLKQNKLPPLVCWPYEEQQEISVAGCLFPHYMWLVIDKINKRIIVNPHMFTEENKNNYSLFIEINQKDFCERLRRETSYERGISYDCNSGNEEIIS